MRTSIATLAAFLAVANSAAAPPHPPRGPAPPKGPLAPKSPPTPKGPPPPPPPPQVPGDASNCYCLPGDDCWPAEASWNQLNSTVNGKLHRTTPIGSPCHDPTYDEEACAALREQWTAPLTHIPSSSSIMQTYFANQSCDPFTDRALPCELGNYVSYAVDVQSADDVATALKFARDNSLRTVVRNTGHDFFGRSTGAGALAIWTQSLKTIEFIDDYSDEYYSGKAAKVGAGVLGYEAMEAAQKEGLNVVTGECPTVGVAGGFTQGGGHSTLSTAFGLGSDQVLEFNVVTAAGELVIASPSTNEDLYWALAGGGPGTFGVVVGLTMKAYEAAPVGGAAFQLAAASVGEEQYREVVAKFHELLPAMIDSGAMVVYYVTQQALIMNVLTAWNFTKEEVRDDILAPFTKAVEDMNITLPVSYTEMSFRNHFDTFLGPLPGGGTEVQRYQFGGRLIPRRTLEENNDAYMEVLAKLNANGVIALASAADYSKRSGTPDNSVSPAFREAMIQLQLVTFWDNDKTWEQMEVDQRRMTEEFMPLIEGVTPGSGSYMNEADFRQPDWQESFFGSNYEKLLSIKKKWDPESRFYVLKGVGSEAWEVAESGRMCRA